MSKLSLEFGDDENGEIETLISQVESVNFKMSKVCYRTGLLLLY